MFKQKNYLALGAVVAGGSAGFEPAAAARPRRLKLAIGSLFLPLFGLANAAQQLPGRPGRRRPAAPRTAPADRNLRHENEQLKVQPLQAAAIARENDQLRALLGWQRQVPWKLKLANVVMRDPANWWRTVQIDLGSARRRARKPARADRRRPGRPRFVRRPDQLAGRFDRRSQLPRFRARRKSGARHRHHQRRAGRWTIRSSI